MNKNWKCACVGLTIKLNTVLTTLLFIYSSPILQKKIIFLPSALLFNLHLLLKAEPTHSTYKPAHSIYITILCDMFLYSSLMHDLSADK
jgi:hypothetical protein